MQLWCHAEEDSKEWTLGYKTDIGQEYDFGHEIGRGAHGIVRVVVSKQTGKELACKSIAKVPAADATPQKIQEHLAGLPFPFTTCFYHVCDRESDTCH